MGLLKWTYGPLNALERFAGVAETPENGVSPGGNGNPAFTDPVRKIDLLRRLAGQMDALTPRLAVRGVTIPDTDMVPQVSRYLDMIQAAALRRA